MAKAKAKREEADEKGDYEFKLPAFDEKRFIVRELESAKASFYTLGIGTLAGVIAVGLYFVSPERWALGWLPIVIALVGLRPILQRMGFSEDVVSWKALAGSYFMIFFTGLSVWILGANLR